MDNLNLTYEENFLPDKELKKLKTVFLESTEIKWLPKSITRVKMAFGYVNVPREQQAYSFDDRKLYYEFSGTKIPTIQKVPECLINLRDQIYNEFGIKYNFCLVNKYNDGNNYIGYHYDSEKNLVNKSSIASFSIGQTRKMAFKNKSNLIYKLDIKENDLLVIDYPTNKFWKHSILKTQVKNIGPRVNFTFRLMY